MAVRSGRSGRCIRERLGPTRPSDPQIARNGPKICFRSLPTIYSFPARMHGLQRFGSDELFRSRCYAHVMLGPGAGPIGRSRATYGAPLSTRLYHECAERNDLAQDERRVQRRYSLKRPGSSVSVAATCCKADRTFNRQGMLLTSSVLGFFYCTGCRMSSGCDNDPIL